MRDDGNDTDTRLEAAKAAAPYVHPKLASVEVRGDPNAPIEHNHTVDAFTARIARLAVRAAEDEERASGRPEAAIPFAWN